MKHTMLLWVLIFSAAHANETVLDFTCSSPDAHYLNRFEMKGSLLLLSNPQKKQTIISNTNLEANVRRAGYDGDFQKLNLNGFKGTAKYENEISWTTKPFYIVSLRPKTANTTEVAHVQLNIDYPGKLSSFVRMQDNLTYKAGCELIKFSECIFPDSLSALESDQNFIMEKVADVYTYSRVYEGQDDFIPYEAIHVRKIRLTYKKNKRVYFLYHTFEDQYDGGNTIGWIEDSETMEKVSTIGDSDLYGCKVFD